MSAAEYTIGRHCGVTFAGLKPASLVSIDRSEAGMIACLSDKFGAKGFCFVVLGGCQDRVLVYVYHVERLRKLLFSCEVRMFLRSFGYEYGSVAEAIRQLKGRMSGEFPHEIGVFLGYPLSDVRGFIDDPNGCILCGFWKVYSNADEAERTFERYRRCSACICRHMQRGRSLTQIFNVG